MSDRIRAALDPIASELRGSLKYGQDLAPIAWFRVGGPAEALLQPADEADLARFLAVLPAEIPVTVIGLGSNLLIRDGGLDGVVVRLSMRGFGAVTVQDGLVTVGAATPDKRFSEEMARADIEGFAFYNGIPGGIGGALRMNAGANGSETRDRLVSVRAIGRDGQALTLSAEDMGHTYRHSAAPADLIFVSATYRAEPGNHEAIRTAMQEVTEHRERAQPIREKTGGSTFKNPEGARAWELIDRAGCRGLVIGDAQVSEKHCNFLINRGAASAHDLELLGETVRARVLETSQVRLSWEIKRLGHWQPGAEIMEFLGR
ncbi:MAG: UDP-N-acetylmuramate dehydrogenase [Pseudomonadota bacterium]